MNLAPNNKKPEVELHTKFPLHLTGAGKYSIINGIFAHGITVGFGKNYVPNRRFSALADDGVLRVP